MNGSGPWVLKKSECFDGLSMNGSAKFYCSDSASVLS
jgi:hypothetical protein